MGPDLAPGDMPDGVGAGVNKNSLIKADAHARTEAWYESITRQYVNCDPKCSLDIPHEVEYRINYPTTDIFDIRDSYNSYDNVNAHKNSRADVQGENRGLNILKDFQTGFFKAGENASSLKVYAPQSKTSPVPEDWDLRDILKWLKTKLQTKKYCFSSIKKVLAY